MLITFRLRAYGTACSRRYREVKPDGIDLISWRSTNGAKSSTDAKTTEPEAAEMSSSDYFRHAARATR
jgi:hypothetical protein